MWTEYLNRYRMDCQEIWCRSPDSSSCTTTRLAEWNIPTTFSMDCHESFLSLRTIVPSSSSSSSILWAMRKLHRQLKPSQHNLNPAGHNDVSITFCAISMQLLWCVRFSFSSQFIFGNLNKPFWLNALESMQTRVSFPVIPAWKSLFSASLLSCLALWRRQVCF